MLFLTESDVRRLLPMSKAIELMREAFSKLGTGEAINQPRRRLILPTGSVLHYMAASDGKYFGTKIYSTHPAHGAHFLFLLYRAVDARPLAQFEANYLGQIRTGAVSGLATGLLAPPGAAILGMIGSGFQALSQLQAIATVRDLREVRVWSRSAARRDEFSRQCAEELGLSVQLVGSAGEAVRGAEIVVTATSAKDPVLAAEWVSPGTHINAVGSNQPGRRELPAELIHRADLIAVDSLEQSKMESGDLLLALDPSDWNSTRIVELKDVLSTPCLGRSDPAQITIFKSNGLAIEDVTCAGYVYEVALKNGMGQDPPICQS